MTETLNDYGVLPSLFEAARGLPQPEEVRRRREEAWESFEQRGFPTLHEEEWRFTNVATVAKTAFAAPARREAAELAAEIERFRLAGAVELVFVDGRFAPELSSRNLPEGVAFRTFASADAGTLAERLGSQADAKLHPFVALSTALFEDAALLEIARAAVVEPTLHLIFYATAQAHPSALFPRTVLVARERSQSTVVESFAGAAGAVYLTCPVSEILAEEAAVVDHYKFQRESREAFHLSAIALETGRAASFSTHSFSLGGAIVRHDIGARLLGEGGEAILNGLYMVEGRQLCDTHMRVDHVAPHCDSHELYKGILDGKARAVFNGRIHVHPGAQKTDAKQTNRNLLLSDDALVNTNPQLEIFADDVKCTHGSTVGQLDGEAVFYLRSRGIGLEAATSLLTYAFASDLVERVKVPALKHELQEFLFAWIPQGDVVRDAV